MSDIAETPVNPPEPTAAGAGPAGNTTDFRALYEAAVAEAGDWKKRFTGLQGTFQREQSKWSTAEPRIKELEDMTRGFDSERTALQGQLQDLQGKLAELDTLKASHERISIIAKEFPDLLEFESDGLLPGDTGDVLRTKLNALRGKLQAKSKEDTLEKVAGAVPPAPKGESPKGAQELLSAAIAALREGKNDEYQRLYSEYLSASSK